MKPFTSLYRVFYPAFALLFSLFFAAPSSFASSLSSPKSSTILFALTDSSSQSSSDSLDTQSIDRDRDNLQPGLNPDEKEQIKPNNGDEKKLYREWKKSLKKRFPKELCLLEPTSVGSFFYKKITYIFI
jgi:hypothetical protein